MGIISKFVINRNKIGFFYIEKHLLKNEIQYVWHDGNEFGAMSQETFQSTFGNDKKYSLLKFLDKVEIDILRMGIDDNRISQLGIDAINISNKLKKDNYHNPSLIGYSFAFINVLKTYNSLVLKNINNDNEEQEIKATHDYEEEYHRVQKRQEFNN